MDTLGLSGSAAAQVPSEQVMRQLETILSSETFKNSSRLSRFLRYVVEQRLQEYTALNERRVGTEVFDRDERYDTRADPVVRVEARQLRFKLAEYYANAGVTDDIIISLPKGGYTAHFEWRPGETVKFSEIAADKPADLANDSPAGVAPAPVDTTALGQGRLRRPGIWLCAAAGILCVAGAIAAWRAFSTPKAASIAVLPFANLTADPANQYFSDGLADEITDSLGRFKTLRVIARASAFHFKGKRVDVREVGRLLHVSHVVEGSCERSGDSIRIVARLERVSDGSLVWSNTYERPNSDMFAVESDLAAAIAQSLQAGVGIPLPKHVPNAEAHDYLVKARYDLQQMTPQSLAHAETEYQRAIDLDSQYAAAYLGLGAVQYDEYIARGSGHQTEAERRNIERLLRKTLELDPQSPSAHAMLGILAMQYDWDWGRAEREFQLALASSPNAIAESHYAFLLIFRGRFPEADQHLRRLLDLDPFSMMTMNNLALARILERRFAEAQEMGQRLLAEYPNTIAPQQIIGGTYIGENRPQLAASLFRQLRPRFPQAQLFEAMACAEAGHREEALRLIRPFEEKYQNSGVAMEWFALVYAFMGDEPNTVKWLQRSEDRHEWQVLNIAVQPAYASMENTPEFLALKKRIGLAQ
ncbi:MAG TPA: hypothetical protein VHZ07_11175 [Bryobacteraceae bacterium]|jgi:TolB-like protein/Tfp pilus assembly protein PilF|nr:hypothetical protein [Bryobacteraceae bacterium]